MQKNKLYFQPEKYFFRCYICIIICIAFSTSVLSQEHTNESIDTKVKAFLESRKSTWRNMNISESDGKVLYDIIMKNKYTKALEIGTSTGHSGIWIAWALSKTGGKLITLEIDNSRHKKALENFEKAGLSEYIDARLADAHTAVAELSGPFDFVFSDADKKWYTKYLKLLEPKLEVGGCFTAHNVANRFMAGIQEFLTYVQGLSHMETTIINPGSSGISVSYKKSKE